MEPLGPRHHAVQRLRALVRDRAERRSADVYAAEGVRLVEGLLERHADVRELFIESGARLDDRISALCARSESLGIPVTLLADGVGQRIGDTVHSQGVFAEVGRAVASIDAVLATQGPLLILDALQDPGNVGTILRSAEAAGCSAVLFTGSGVDPWNTKVVRASAGSIAGVSIVECADNLEVIASARERGFHTIATVARGGVEPDRALLSDRIAIVVGSEANGLDDAVVGACDTRVTIPMHGPIESLNAGVAASLLVFEAARQRAWRMS